MTEITQEDRQAAADFNDELAVGTLGMDDLRDLFAAFARHRQAARERALVEAAEVADVEGRRNQVISDDFKRGDTNRNSAWNQMVASDRIASQIRKLKEG